MVNRNVAYGNSGYCRFVVPLLLSLALLLFTGCFPLPLSPKYQGPEVRPAELDQYYAVGDSYSDYLEEVLWETDSITLKRIDIDSEFGPIKVDYCQRKDAGEELILVFPIMGGSNKFANYFALYFAEKGFDTAVVHRDKAFKRPENYERMEQLFRENVIKDRVALDFFEREYGKKTFGSFGISRGAINAAVTAGVDKRLEFNVLAMGGADLVEVFRHSSVRGFDKYRDKVMKRKNISEEEFYRYLQETVRTDPKMLGQYVDARRTLLFLALFDHAVPIEYGMKLRRIMGYPETQFLASGHVTSLAYTQMVRIFPPSKNYCLFPMDYVETESVAFYRKSFGSSKTGLKHIFFSVLQAPFKIIGKIVSFTW